MRRTGKDVCDFYGRQGTFSGLPRLYRKGGILMKRLFTALLLLALLAGCGGKAAPPEAPVPPAELPEEGLAMALEQALEQGRGKG